MSWSLASFIVYVDLANLHFDEFYRTHSDFFLYRIQKKEEQIKKIMRLRVSNNNGQFSDSDIYVHIITVIFSSMWSITSSDRADSSSNWSYVIHRVCKRNMLLASETGGILFNTLTLKSSLQRFYVERKINVWLSTSPWKWLIITKILWVRWL